MNAHIQAGLLRLSDPRIIQLLLIGTALVLIILGHGDPVGACPTGGGGECTGG